MQLFHAQCFTLQHTAQRDTGGGVRCHRRRSREWRGGAGICQGVSVASWRGDEEMGGQCGYTVANISDARSHKVDASK